MPECAIHPITYRGEGILATVVKKSLAPPREYSGYEYELYHVRKQQNASNRRPVGLRPAGRFLSIFADCHFRQKIRWKRRRCQFDHFCKLVLYHEAVDYFRERKRQRGWETSFETLPLSELDTLCTIDQYPSDSFIFPAYGCELQISDGLVAAAFASLPQPGQSILILHCVLELTDGEIGAVVGMSRSAVQRHRTKTLETMRTRLTGGIAE